MSSPRQEHIKLVKKRALEYVELGQIDNALASFYSDMSKHPETEDHAAITLAGMLTLGGHLSTQDEMRNFINGIQ